MRDYRDAKVMARALRSGLTDHDLKLTHSQSLELMAKAFGYDNWNILAAKIEADRPAAAETALKGKTLHCSFCGKSQHDVKILIAGPSSFVCGECVGLCNDIVEHHEVLAMLAEDEADASPGHPKVEALLVERSGDQLRVYQAAMERDMTRMRDGLRSAEEAIKTRAAGGGDLGPPFKTMSDEELAAHQRRLDKTLAGTVKVMDMVKGVLEARG